jgi:hypothetical protein
LPVSELLARWSSRELLEIRALLIIEKEEAEEARLALAAEHGAEMAKRRQRP